MAIASAGVLVMIIAVAVAAAGGRIRPAAAPYVSALAALTCTGMLAWIWAAGGGVVIDLPWITLLGSRLLLGFDPLSHPLTIFTAGLAVPVLLYTAGYLPQHLERHGRAPTEQARFCRLMLVFMLAMLLLFLAQDLIVMFAALELTALTSYLLIEFDRDDPAARSAAQVALVVTIGSSLLFLAGALIIAAEAGTAVLPELLARLPELELPSYAIVCLAAGVLGKSAQVPLHFWLPRAMVAPTPVSAYLHSAALVAAGVFVLARLNPLVQQAPGLDVALETVGFVSIAVGGTLALTSDGLKRILAYSTIAQYGYVLVLLGAGGAAGWYGATFFLLAHGLSKCALFMTAGAVTTLTGATRLSETGGLARRMPWLSAAAAVAAIGLAGLPLTIGYFKDELLFAAGHRQGAMTAVLTVATAALTLAYIGRFWSGIFLGRAAGALRHTGKWMLVAPVVLLAVLVVIGAFMPAALNRAFLPAAEVVAGHAMSFELRYDFGWRPESWMALSAWLLGGALLALHRHYAAAIGRLTRFAARTLGPARLSWRIAGAIDTVSDTLHRMELRDLRDRISAVLLPTAALVLLGWFGQVQFMAPVGAIRWADVPVAAGLITTTLIALAIARRMTHVGRTLLLSFLSSVLALTFALAGAPDLALVVVIVGAVLTVLFLAVLAQIRTHSFAAREDEETSRGDQPDTRSSGWTALAAGTAAFFVCWFALGATREQSMAAAYVARADAAHAGDLVSAILADFRGLDTLAEITVLAVAIMGAAAVGWGRRT